MSGKGEGGSQKQASEGRTERVWGEATAPVISCNSLFRLPMLPECLRAFYMWSYSDIHVIK